MRLDAVRVRLLSRGPKRAGRRVPPRRFENVLTAEDLGFDAEPGAVCMCSADARPHMHYESDADKKAKVHDARAGTLACRTAAPAVSGGTLNPDPTPPRPRNLHRRSRLVGASRCSRCGGATARAAARPQGRARMAGTPRCSSRSSAARRPRPSRALCRGTTLRERASTTASAASTTGCCLGTRRVQLVRRDGRDVSTLYGREGGGGRGCCLPHPAAPRRPSCRRGTARRRLRRSRCSPVASEDALHPRT
jgi:hypothetical protein